MIIFYLRDTQAAGEVAVKILATQDKERYDRAKREMNLLNMFYKHKRICTMIHGTALDAVQKCICIFQFYELGTVQTLLDEGHAEFTHRAHDQAPACLRFRHAVDMAKDVLEGLECMHKMMIVHRDIKPANICVEISSSAQSQSPSTTQLRFTIIDLGAAVSIEAVTSDPESVAGAVGFTGQFTSLAGVKVPLGTVLYMSPEHIDEDRAVDGRSDVFSFGVTMYYCLCGRFPFVQPEAVYDAKRLALKLMGYYTGPKEAEPLYLGLGVRPRAGEELAAIITKSLRKLPKDRYHTAHDMKTSVERIERYRAKYLSLRALLL